MHPARHVDAVLAYVLIEQDVDEFMIHRSAQIIGRVDPDLVQYQMDLVALQQRKPRHPWLQAGPAVPITF